MNIRTKDDVGQNEPNIRCNWKNEGKLLRTTMLNGEKICPENSGQMLEATKLSLECHLQRPRLNTNDRYPLGLPSLAAILPLSSA